MILYGCGGFTEAHLLSSSLKMNEDESEEKEAICAYYDFPEGETCRF